MIYGYKCPACKQTYTSSQRGDRLLITCVECGYHTLHRDYSGISLSPPMQEHWNTSLNRPISSMRQFEDGLKAEGERLSQYTQVEQRLEVLDPEQAKIGVTDEGLEATNRKRVQTGQRPINLDQI